jgi:2'-5' RNA ligase
MPSIRSFISIPITNEIGEAISAVQQRIKSFGANVQWESPEKFHLTLKFLGDAEPLRVLSVSDKLKHSFSSQPPFTITFSAAGAFPTIHQPRIVWVGAEPSEQLQAIVRTVEQSASVFGFELEERPFHAHITIGRVKSNRNIHGLTEALKNIMFEPIILECSEIRIVKSELHPAGSVYSTLDSIRLTSLR